MVLSCSSFDPAGRKVAFIFGAVHFSRDTALSVLMATQCYAHFTCERVCKKAWLSLREHSSSSFAVMV